MVVVLPLPVRRRLPGPPPGRLSSLAAAVLATGAVAVAQTLEVDVAWSGPRGELALHQAALDASTDQLALIVASHPDDRYVMPAAYLRFALGWRVAVLLATRGEGGQNSLGPQTGDELGWIRTLEAEAGAAALDCDVYYLNRQDAGYCRTAGEALDVWGRDESVRRLARVIRLTRPDVIVTTHHPEEPHGHDLALLELVPPAIAAAAADSDAAELRGLAPFTVRKALRGATPSEVAAARTVLPMEEVDEARGETYRRLAYAALKRHRSQEPIRPMRDLFEPTVPLVPWDGAASSPAGELMTGLSTVFDALRISAPDEAAGLTAALDDLVHRTADRHALLATAVTLHARLRALPAEPGGDVALRRARRLRALERVMLAAASFDVSAEVMSDAPAIAGKSFPLSLRVQHSGRARIAGLTFEPVGPGVLEIDPDAFALLAEPPRGPLTVHGVLHTPGDAIDRPRWLQRIFRAETFEPPVRLRCRVELGLVGVEGRRIEIEHRVDVATDLRPPREITTHPEALLLRRDAEAQSFSVRVAQYDREAARPARLEILGPPGFEIVGSPVAVRMDRSEYRDYQFELRVSDRLEPGVYNLHVRLGDHRRVLPVHKLDLQVPNQLSVGLIAGVDDTARQVLGGLVGRGLRVLTEDDLHELRRFDTIVIDIRALRERAGDGTWRAARAAFPRLLQYVHDGGRLVVFYHKDTEFNADQARFVGWPYPLHIGKGRVTREDSPVRILAPDHRLLRHPNVIQPEDWDGWVQERGLYFPDEWAPEYTELIALSDPDQPEMTGALLHARYGAGEYIYCALSLYRQLNSLHPGACRIFANLVSP